MRNSRRRAPPRRFGAGASPLGRSILSPPRSGAPGCDGKLVARDSRPERRAAHAVLPSVATSCHPEAVLQPRDAGFATLPPPRGQHLDERRHRLAVEPWPHMDPGACELDGDLRHAITARRRRICGVPRPNDAREPNRAPPRRIAVLEPVCPVTQPARRELLPGAELRRGLSARLPLRHPPARSRPRSLMGRPSTRQNGPLAERSTLPYQSISANFERTSFHRPPERHPLYGSATRTVGTMRRAALCIATVWPRGPRRRRPTGGGPLTEWTTKPIPWTSRQPLNGRAHRRGRRLGGDLQQPGANLRRPRELGQRPWRARHRRRQLDAHVAAVLVGPLLQAGRVRWTARQHPTAGTLGSNGAPPSVGADTVDNARA